MISAWVGAPQKWPGDKLFKLRKSTFWVSASFFLNSNFKSKYLTFFYLLTYLFFSLLWRTSVRKHLLILQSRNKQIWYIFESWFRKKKIGLIWQVVFKLGYYFVNGGRIPLLNLDELRQKSHTTIILEKFVNMP